MGHDEDLKCGAWDTCFLATQGEQGTLIRSVENSGAFLRIDADLLTLVIDDTGAEPERSWTFHEKDYDYKKQSDDEEEDDDDEEEESEEAKDEENP